MYIQTKQRANTMKKTLLTLAATIAIATSASANDIQMIGYEFGSGEYDMGGKITVNIKNLSNKEVVAGKYNIVCDDAFGDRALTMKIKDTSMNIAPGASNKSSWVPNMFSKMATLLKNNDAKNFDCKLEDIKVILN